MTAPDRRLPAVIAGCFAIAASLTTMGVIVVSDIAEARESVETATLSDELEVSPVKMTPTRVQVVEPPDLMDLLGDEAAQKAASGISPPVSARKSKKRRIDFGAFEGY